MTSTQPERFCVGCGAPENWLDDLKALERQVDWLERMLRELMHVAAQYLDTGRGDIDGVLDFVRHGGYSCPDYKGSGFAPKPTKPEGGEVAGDA